MQPYVISLGAGLLAGVLYGLLGVRSPAPPAIALIGLLGILAGEQLVPLVKHLAAGGRPDLAWARRQAPHAFGALPTRADAPFPSVPQPVPLEPDQHA
jgi:XapX domain-containing protein